MILQNTPEWLEARAGKITASRFCDVMAFDEGGELYKSGPKKGQPKPARVLKARTDYIGEIVAELLTGAPMPQARARAMDWGHDVEAAARDAYSAHTGELVSLGGFLIHPSHPFIGCSPDGLVGDDGGLQIKCPANPSVHIETLRAGMPAEHIHQVQGELWVSGRQWWDFVSFDPRMPPNLRLYTQRVLPDPAYIARLEAACLSLWGEVQGLMGELHRRAA